MISQGLVKLILSWIEEDAPLGDVTTEALIDKGVAVKAVVLAKDDGYACCLADFAEALNALGLRARALKADGEPFHRGEVLMEITGDARVVLVLERSLLNALSYLMGVVRETRRVVELVRSVNPRVRVAATRKTIPGLRMLVKKAVSVGGADTHRLSLSDAILIKDNHMAIIGDVEAAVRRAKAKSTFMHKVEVEVGNADDAVKAVKAGADAVLVDNATPQQLREVIERLKAEGLRDRVIVEASGGVKPENIALYAEAGPDVISTSHITMRASPVDISLEVVEVIKNQETPSDGT